MKIRFALLVTTEYAVLRTCYRHVKNLEHCSLFSFDALTDAVPHLALSHSP